MGSNEGESPGLSGGRAIQVEPVGSAKDLRQESPGCPFRKPVCLGWNEREGTVKEVTGAWGCRGLLGLCENAGIYSGWDGHSLGGITS